VSSTWLPFLMMVWLLIRLRQTGRGYLNQK